MLCAYVREVAISPERISPMFIEDEEDAHFDNSRCSDGLIDIYRDPWTVGHFLKFVEAQRHFDMNDSPATEYAVLDKLCKDCQIYERSALIRTWTRKTRNNDHVPGGPVRTTI